MLAELNKMVLVQRLISVRAELKHSVVDKWRLMLRTRVHDNGQHLEHMHN